MAESITVEGVYGPVDALHWYLTDEEIMWQALKDLIREHGHRGVVSEWPDGQGGERWLIELNDAAGNTATATLGQHLVLTERLWSWDQAYFETVKH